MTARVGLLTRSRQLVSDPVVLMAGALSVFVAAAVGASDDDGPVLCVFRRGSGGYCPGCGLTRSAGMLIRGDLGSSWGRHPYLSLLLGQLLALGLAFGVDRTRVRALIGRYATTIIMSNAALLLGIWAWRLATGAIPIPFR